MTPKESLMFVLKLLPVVIIGGAISQSENWMLWIIGLALSFTAVCFASKSFGGVQKALSLKLDTKIKRKLFLLCPMGCVSICLALCLWPLPLDMIIMSPASLLPPQFDGVWIRSLLSMFWFGLTLAALGLLLSFGYNITVLKVRNWIQAGS